MKSRPNVIIPTALVIYMGVHKQRETGNTVAKHLSALIQGKNYLWWINSAKCWSLEEVKRSRGAEPHSNVRKHQITQRPRGTERGGEEDSRQCSERSSPSGNTDTRNRDRMRQRVTGGPVWHAAEKQEHTWVLIVWLKLPRVTQESNGACLPRLNASDWHVTRVENTPTTCTF